MKILAPWGLWFLVSVGMVFAGRMNGPTSLVWTCVGLFAAWLIITVTAIGLLAWLLTRDDEAW